MYAQRADFQGDECPQYHVPVKGGHLTYLE